MIIPAGVLWITALQLLAPFILALGFRLRGAAVFHEWTGRGATTARIVCFAIPCGLIAWGLGLAWPWAIALGVAAWVGCLPPWWGSLDLARQYGDYGQDFALHTLRGVVWVLPMAVVLFAAGEFWPGMLLAGTACGAIYEAGYRIRESHGAEIGEVGFGFVIGCALVGALL